MFDTEIKSLKSFNHYLIKLVESRLWLKVIIALFLGIGFGLLLSPQNGWISKETGDIAGNWLALPGVLFLKLVQMIMIPLIVASIITGIATNDKDSLKKLGGGVLLYFLGTTIVSVSLGTILSQIFRPGRFLHQQALSEHNDIITTATEDAELSFGFDTIPGAISNLLPENPLVSMVSGEMLSVVIFTIINGVIYADCATLCKHADIISLHVPLKASTKHLIDREHISLMKPGVMLINTSRGRLVDTKAVIEGLKTKKINYFGIDVYEEEEGLFFEDHSEDILQDDVIARLMTFNNVLITSHQAFLTETALTNIAETTIYNLDCFEKQEPSGNEIISEN